MVVSNFVKLSLYIYTLLLLYYYYFNIYTYYLTTYYTILLYINTLSVGSKLIFLRNQLTTLLHYLYIEKSYTLIQQNTITLIYIQNLYVNTTICTNFDILIKLIYCTHYTHVHDI